MRHTHDVLDRAMLGVPPDPLATGPRAFREIVHERADVRIFEQDLFNALLPHEVKRGDRTVSPRAYATHWFELSWMTQT